MCEDEGPRDAGLGRASAGSEVVIIGDQDPPALVPPPPGRPYISSMNFTNSPGARIGDDFVTVTNINHSDEVVKGRFLGLELISPANTRRLRCSVAVFVCWALVVASGFAAYFFFFAFSNKFRIDIGLNETWYLRRNNWQALPPSSTYEMAFLKLPVNIAMIGHSATPSCTDKYNCIKVVRDIQKDHIERFGEIAPNFLVGGDEGFVFEGRGANVVGAVVAGGNTKQVSIMFLGDYTVNYPNESQLNHVSSLLDVLVKDGVLDKNYVLYGYCQIKTFTVSPGPHIMKKLPDFPHWRNTNATMCLNITHQQPCDDCSEYTQNVSA